MYVYTLEQLASKCYASVDLLRSIAADQCGLGNEEQWIVDCWLLDRLGRAAQSMGPHFSLFDADSVLSALSHALMRYEGTFVEKCAASFAVIKANPIGVREVKLRDLDPDFIIPTEGAYHESHYDLLGMLPKASWALLNEIALRALQTVHSPAQHDTIVVPENVPHFDADQLEQLKAFHAAFYARKPDEK